MANKKWNFGGRSAQSFSSVFQIIFTQYLNILCNIFEYLTEFWKYFVFFLCCLHQNPLHMKTNGSVDIIRIYRQEPADPWMEYIEKKYASLRTQIQFSSGKETSNSSTYLAIIYSTWAPFVGFLLGFWRWIAVDLITS